MTRDERVDLALKFLDGFARKDLDGAFALLAGDAAISARRNDPPESAAERRRGNAVLKGVHKRVVGAMPNGLRFIPRHIVVEGDHVCIEARGDGVNLSGEPYCNAYHFAFEVRDGKIHALREYLDTQYLAESFPDLEEIRAASASEVDAARN